MCCAPHNGHVLALNLSKLTRAQSSAIVSKLTNGKALPAELLEQVLSKTDGVPLYLEELIRDILESGFLTEHNDRYTINGALPALAIPASLQDSLMARLDRLGSTKEIAQIGACIGREFSHEILAAVSPHSSADLERDVQRLVESGLVGRHGHTAQAAYTFKHALVQDAAYQSLLKSRRKTIHQDIARVLQARFAEQIQSKPELLALHLTQAGLINEAVPKWRTAARLAAKGTRYREAQSHVDSALAIVTLLPDAVRANVEVSLLVTGAFCRFAIEGYASESAAQMLARVEEVLDHVTDTNTLDIALWAIGVHAWVRGNLPKALATYERLTALAEQTNEIDRMVFAYFCLGTALNNVAQFARGYRLLEFVIEKYQTERHGQFVYAIGQDLKTSTSSFIGMIRLWSGRANEARHYSQLSIAHSEAIAHPFSLAMALSFASLVLAEMGECEDAIRLSNRCIELSELQKLPHWRAWAIFAEGIALVRQGYYDRGLANLNQTSQIFQAMGQQTGSAWIRAWQAIALAHLGRFADARRQADLGIQSCHESGEILHLPWVLHARGIAEQLDTNAETATAEYWLNEALAEARSHDNRWLELRVAYSLAGLWRSQGKRKEALDLLKPVYDWFTEGFDTKDLKDAKALLVDLNE